MAEPNGRDSPGGLDAGGRAERRHELAAFLRSRRERITPEDAGLPGGYRRRTAGLRREEVAQLSGVGVTWYTWLEQGRPIRASVQVLEAVARTLQLDAIERQHLFRLAEVPDITRSGGSGPPLRPQVQVILDGLNPMPVSVMTERFDILAWNAAYEVLFPRTAEVPVAERNTLLQAFTRPDCCSVIENRAEQRAAHGRPAAGGLRPPHRRPGLDRLHPADGSGQPRVRGHVGDPGRGPAALTTPRCSGTRSTRAWR